MSRVKINNLIVIGTIGSKLCYLNIGRDAAIKEYCKETNTVESEIDTSTIEEVNFDTKFTVYDIWE